MIYKKFTQYGLMSVQYSGPDGSNSSTFPIVSAVDEIHPVNGQRKGDFKTPGPFSFRSSFATGSNYLRYSSGFQTNNGRFYSQDSGDLLEADPALNLRLSPDWELSDDSALAKVFEKLRGNSNLAVDLAESGATLRMLRNALSFRKLIAEFFKRVVKTRGYRRLSKGQQRLDYVTGKWLEYRYGWLPLVYSTYDLLDTIGRKVDGGLVTVRGRSSHKLMDRLTSGDGSYNSPERVELTELQFRTEMKFRFRLPSGNQIYDFTSLSPASIAWELVPLSFVADWFVNIGELLSLWENHVIYSNSFVDGYRTRSYREDYDRTYVGKTYTPVQHYQNGHAVPGTYVRISSGKSKVIRRGLDRVVLRDLPAPIGGLRFTAKLNASRFMDAVSLIQVFTRKKLRNV